MSGFDSIQAVSDGTGVRSPRSEDGLFRVRSKDIISCFKFGLQNKFRTKRDTITDDFLFFFGACGGREGNYVVLIVKYL